MKKLNQIKDPSLAEIGTIDTSHNEFLIINNELSKYLQEKSLSLTSDHSVLQRETNSEDLISFAEKYIYLGDKFNLSDTLPDYANHKI